MKITISFLVASLMLYTTRAWVIGTREIQKAVSVAGISAALGFSNPAVVTAAVDFTGSYSDPKHPNCLRVIDAPLGAADAKISGTDGNPGCPPDGSGKEWTLFGSVSGSTITVDFSPKGGPANLKGIWDDDASSSPGIKWPDGNKWTLKSSN